MLCPREYDAKTGCGFFLAAHMLYTQTNVANTIALNNNEYCTAVKLATKQ